MDGIVEKVREIVLTKYYDEWDLKYHIPYVLKYSALLAKKQGADPEIVELSVLLHDITRIKGDREDHHITGAVEAEKILKNLGYPKDRIQGVVYCIRMHRGAVTEKRETKEAECVASADAMSHFDIIDYFIETFGKEWTRKKLERSWAKMMPEAKDILEDKYQEIKKQLQ